MAAQFNEIIKHNANILSSMVENQSCISEKDQNILIEQSPYK